MEFATGFGVRKLLYINIILAFEDKIGILESASYPFRRSNDVVDTDLSIRVIIDICKAFIINLESFYRTGENRPHLRIELCKVSDVLAFGNTYTGSTSNIVELPLVLTFFVNDCHIIESFDLS